MKQIDKDRYWFAIRQTPPENLGSDGEIEALRQTYADASADDLANHIVTTYKSNPEGARAFLEKERFECQERSFIQCKSLSMVYALSKDPFAPFTREPTHCLFWTVQMHQTDQEITRVE